MRRALAARVQKTAALKAFRIELERLAVLVQGHQQAGMVDDVDVRRARRDVGDGRIAWGAQGAEQWTPRLVFHLPSRGANPAIAIAGPPPVGAASVLGRLEEEAVDHAVAVEDEGGAPRIELRIGSVAVIGAGQRVRDAARDFQLEVVLAAHRRQRTGKLGLGGLRIGHGVTLGWLGLLWDPRRG